MHGMIMKKTRRYFGLAALLATLFLPAVLAGQGRPMPKAAGPQMYQPTLKDFDLRGKVRTVTQLTRFVGGQDMNTEETWDFDEQGRMVRQTKRGFGGEHVATYPMPRETDKRQKTIVDIYGDIQEVRHYASDGHTLLCTEHYVYAKGGGLAAKVAYNYSATDTGVVESHTETYYDKAGRVASVEQYSADAVLLMKVRCKYNRHGDLKLRTQQFFDDVETETTKEARKYKYDKAGNWTEQAYLRNGKELYAILRTISYYD